MPEPITKAVVVREIPIDLWRQLKIRAALEDTTIQATVTKAIQQYLQSA